MSINVRQIANTATSVVNSNLTVGWRRYEGYSILPSGKSDVVYTDAVPMVCQVQALSKEDVRHLDAINLSNCDRMVYAYGQLAAMDRLEQTGGDILVFEDGEWLVTAILEGWTTAGWCRAALTRQIGTTPPAPDPGP